MKYRMDKDITFQPGWFGFNLPGYRPCDSTYCFFPYHSLPPLTPVDFQGKFDWLEPLEEPIISIMAPHWPTNDDRRQTAANLQSLTMAAAVMNISLPQSFIHFMSSVELQNRIPSCTACYFDLRDRFLYCPVDGDNLVIRFLNDQQGVVAWYLYLKPNGDHSVIVSCSWLDLLRENEDFTIDDFAEAIQDTYYCASSFEEFLYRYWLENKIWFALVEKHRTLTIAEQRYLQSYKSRKLVFGNAEP